jgi:hypothetical protein
MESSVNYFIVFLSLIKNIFFRAPTSELLERQTRALEESLNKLKLAMHSDKTKSTYIYLYLYYKFFFLYLFLIVTQMLLFGIEVKQDHYHNMQIMFYVMNHDEYLM